MGRRAIRTIRDHWDDRWAVYEVRPTEHGWPIYLGRPRQAGVPLNRAGGNRVILTTELVEYLESIRHERGAIRLPIGRSTVKRLRGVLGHNIYLDLRQWWEDHAEELASMTEAEFAARHGFAAGKVSQASQALFGRRIREPGWWRAEPARSLLAGDAPRAEVAETLGISVGAVGRLRWALRQETHDDR